VESTNPKSQDKQSDKGAIVPPCVILAGGRAERLGGIDKCLLPLAGKRLVQHTLEGLGDKVSAVALNANGDPARFSFLQLPIVQDKLPDCGPLAGICAGFAWAEAEDPGGAWIFVVSGDTPFIPGGLIEILASELDAHEMPPAIVMPVIGGQPHPLCALWRRDQLADLTAAVYDAGLRSVKEWCHRAVVLEVDMAEKDPGHWFLNINTQADLTRAQKLLKDQF